MDTIDNWNIKILSRSARSWKCVESNLGCLMPLKWASLWLSPSSQGKAFQFIQSSFFHVLGCKIFTKDSEQMRPVNENGDTDSLLPTKYKHAYTRKQITASPNAVFRPFLRWEYCTPSVHHPYRVDWRDRSTKVPQSSIHWISLAHSRSYYEYLWIILASESSITAATSTGIAHRQWWSPSFGFTI